MLTIHKYFKDYFATEKHQVLADIRNYTKTIHKHLIKLILFETSRDMDHWKDEINNHLIEISKPKIKNNIKITSKKYFEILFENPIDPKEPYHDSYLWITIRELLYGKQYASEYSKYRDSHKSKVNTELIDLIYDNIKSFMKTISLHMSKRDLTNEIIKTELDKYIEKY